MKMKDYHKPAVVINNLCGMMNLMKASGDTDLGDITGKPGGGIPGGGSSFNAPARRPY